MRTDTDPQPERSRWRQERGRPSRHREAAAPHRATLLLVDDEEILRSALERNLSFQGYRILCAVDGEDAERVFLEHATEIDAVLLDSNMPLRDGEATFHALRRLRPGLPVVLMSGFAEDGTDRLKDAGLSGFLAKPFRMSEMRRVLQEALGKLDRNGRP